MAIGRPGRCLSSLPSSIVGNALTGCQELSEARAVADGPEHGPRLQYAEPPSRRRRMRQSTRFTTAALAALAAVAAPPRYDGAVNAQGKPAAPRPSLTAPLVDDFQVNGTGDHASWSKVAWTPLRRRQPEGHPYDTRFKCVYSTTGIYFLVDGTDRKLTATMA